MISLILVLFPVFTATRTLPNHKTKNKDGGLIRYLKIAAGAPRVPRHGSVCSNIWRGLSSQWDPSSSPSPPVIVPERRAGVNAVHQPA